MRYLTWILFAVVYLLMVFAACKLAKDHQGAGLEAGPVKASAGQVDP